MNEQKALTLNGKAWTTTSLRGVLLRERNAGLRVHQGEVVGRGDWEPVLDEDTYRRVVAVLTDPGRRTAPASSAVKYLLSGLARCGVCGGPMRVLVANPKQRRAADSYVCQQGYHVRRSRPLLDDLVVALIVGRLSRPDAVNLLTRRDDGGAAQEAVDKAAALRARLDTAADAFAEGTIDGSQLTRITGRLRPELERWQQAARAASTSPDLLDLAGPDIAERWHALPLARQRAVIDLLLTIHVLPAGRGPGFDPDSVQVAWRQGVTVTHS